MSAWSGSGEGSLPGLFTVSSCGREARRKGKRKKEKEKGKGEGGGDILHDPCNGMLKPQQEGFLRGANIHKHADQNGCAS